MSPSNLTGGGVRASAGMRGAGSKDASERRVVVSTMWARHAVSERRVCRVLGF